MGKFPLGWGVNGSRVWSVTNNTFVMPGASGYGDPAGPEASYTRTVYQDFTFSKIQWGDNAPNTGQAEDTGKQLVLKKNGTATALVATGPDNTAGPTWLPTSYTGGPISFVANDTFAYDGELSNDEFNGIKPYCFNTVIETTDNSQVGLYTHQRVFNQNIFGSNTKVYNAIVSGDSQASTTSPNQGVYICTPGVAKHACVYVVDNPAANDVDIYLYKNGVRTALTINIPAGQTGEFSDLVNTVDLAFGDYIQWEINIAVPALVDVSWIGLSIQSNTNGLSDIMTHISKDAGVSISSVAQKNYLKAYGQFTPTTDSSAPIGAGIGYDATLKCIWVDVEANPLDADDYYDFGFTVNGVNQPASMRITQSSGTGFVHDSTQSGWVTINEDDEIAIWFEANSNNNLTIRAYGFAVDDGSSASVEETVKYIYFSDFTEDDDFVDWIVTPVGDVVDGSANTVVDENGETVTMGVGGVNYLSYLETFYHMPEDNMMWMDAPFIYTYMYGGPTVAVTDANGDDVTTLTDQIVTAGVDSALTLKGKWDWVAHG